MRLLLSAGLIGFLQIDCLFAAEPEKLVPNAAAEMVLVAAGPFLMGSADGDPDEAPPHRVNLPAFYIDKYEVTHEQYAKFLHAMGHKPPIDWLHGEMPE